MNRDGALALSDSDGPILYPPVNVPRDSTDIKIRSDGTIVVSQPGSVEDTQIGQIVLTEFANKEGLLDTGQSRFVESRESGTPMDGTPGDGIFGTIVSRHLEGSNVDHVQEMISLMILTRWYEGVGQSLKAVHRLPTGHREAS